MADERKSLQQVRQNYAQELRSRTELEMLLRACVEDVRKEIARRYNSLPFDFYSDLLNKMITLDKLKVLN